MKSLSEIENHIEAMPPKKRAIMEAAADGENMPLIEYLIDLYEWELAQSGNTIIIKNSTIGNITQNN